MSSATGGALTGLGGTNNGSNIANNNTNPTLPVCSQPTVTATAPSCTSGQGAICVTILNFTNEVLQVNTQSDTDASVSLCAQVPAGPASGVPPPFVVSFYEPSTWSIYGTVSRTRYLDGEALFADETFKVAVQYPFISYSSKVVPYGHMAAGCALSAGGVMLWGTTVNRHARKVACGNDPASCALVASRNTKNGRLEYRGYPTGMRKDQWGWPFAVLVVITLGLLVLWVGSRGYFGFSPLNSVQCSARPDGYWFWTSADVPPDTPYHGRDTGFYNWAVRWLGLGQCYSPVLTNLCTINQVAGQTVQWDNTVAQSQSNYNCACYDPTTNAYLNCTQASGSGQCTTCASS